MIYLGKIDEIYRTIKGNLIVKVKEKALKEYDETLRKLNSKYKSISEKPFFEICFILKDESPYKPYFCSIENSLKTFPLSNFIEISKSDSEYYVDDFNFFSVCIWDHLVNEFLNTKSLSLNHPSFHLLTQSNYKELYTFYERSLKYVNKSEKLKITAQLHRIISACDFKTYFQTIYTGIITYIESQPKSSRITFVNNCILSIKNIFSENVYIKEISSKFISLGFQLVNRAVTESLETNNQNAIEALKNVSIIIKFVDKFEEVNNLLISEILSLKLLGLKKITKEEIMEKAKNLISNYVYNKNNSILESIKCFSNIGSLFRGSDKKFIESLSEYAKNFINNFISINQEILSHGFITEIEQQILNNISLFIGSESCKIIENCIQKETELIESLKKFKKNETAEVSDINQIKAQLKYDFEAILKEMKKITNFDLPDLAKIISKL